MATELLGSDQIDLTASRRALILVWQNPETRRFSKVGQIDALPHARIAFHYLPGAANVDGFVHLDEFPSFDGVYVSDEIPAFFANRILSADRRGYDKYLGWLGLSEYSANDIPFEVLARTGAGRATDTFHVVDMPVDDDDRFSSRFFISGIRYSPDADAAISTIRDGADLVLELDESNEANPKAVLIDTVEGTKLGYVPDWLCGDVHALVKSGWTLRAVAERVNADAPAHVRVLCRVEANRNFERRK